MDLARLRFGDFVMASGAVSLLAVMFANWYELVPPGGEALPGIGDFWLNAWQSFSVVDLVLALAAVMALTAVVLTAVQPTAAVPLALSSLTTIVTLVALVLVTIRVIWPPDLGDGALEATRMTGAWVGLVATAVLQAGCLASIRDERLPRPESQVEPRLVEP